MQLTCSLLVSWQKKLLFFSSRTLRVSFNTQGQDVEPNSVIGGDDKAGFEGNVAGYISAENLNIYLFAKFYFLHIQNIIRCYFPLLMFGRCLLVQKNFCQCFRLDWLVWKMILTNHLAVPQRQLCHFERNISKELWKMITKPKPIKYYVLCHSRFCTYCPAILILLSITFRSGRKRFSHSTGKTKQTVTSTSVMLSHLYFIVAFFCVCW